MILEERLYFSQGLKIELSLAIKMGICAFLNDSDQTY
jgi:hypothetical protein